MKTFRKIDIYVSMFLLAVLIAALYGAVHNQISYSFSSEYFTHFKFVQFGLLWAQDTQRLGAAYVGVLATWWMGIILFSILGLFGFMFPSPKQMALELSRSLIIVVTIALITGILGLLYGFLVVNETSISNYSKWLWPDVTHPIQFIRVGFMHNASYLGGLMGLIGGVFYLIMRKRSISAKQ